MYWTSWISNISNIWDLHYIGYPIYWTSHKSNILGIRYIQYIIYPILDILDIQYIGYPTDWISNISNILNISGIQHFGHPIYWNHDSWNWTSISLISLFMIPWNMESRIHILDSMIHERSQYGMVLGNAVVYCQWNIRERRLSHWTLRVGKRFWAASKYMSATDPISDPCVEKTMKT